MSLEQLLKKFIDGQSKTIEEHEHRVEKLEIDVSLIAKQMNMIEVHLGQIESSYNSQQKGKLPSIMEVNLKSYVNAIHLRSRISYDGPLRVESVRAPVEIEKAPTVDPLKKR